MSTMIYKNGIWENTSQIYGDGGMNLIGDDVLYIMQNGMRIRKGSFKNDGWEVIYTPYRPNRFKYPFEFSPLNSNKIWAGDHDIWELQSGKNWVNMTKSVPHGFTKIVAMDVADEDTNVVYFAKDQPTWDASVKGLTGKLYKGVREATGYQWQDITQNLSILAWREITSIATNPSNSNEVYVSLYGLDGKADRHRVYRSLDGGTTWDNYSTGLPNVNTLKILLVEGSKHQFLATDAGIYYRAIDWDQWQKLDNKLPNAHFIDIEYDAYTTSIYAASFGNGIWQLDVTSFLGSE
jgi:hypothetical protein